MCCAACKKKPGYVQTVAAEKGHKKVYKSNKKITEEKRTNGKCLDCSSVAENGGIYCAAHRKHRNGLSEQDRVQRADAGLCHCGYERDQPGKLVCSSCMENRITYRRSARGREVTAKHSLKVRDLVKPKLSLLEQMDRRTAIPSPSSLDIPEETEEYVYIDSEMRSTLETTHPDNVYEWTVLSFDVHGEMSWDHLCAANKSPSEDMRQEWCELLVERVKGRTVVAWGQAKPERNRLNQLFEEFLDEPPHFEYYDPQADLLNKISSQDAELENADAGRLYIPYAGCGWVYDCLELGEGDIQYCPFTLEERFGQFSDDLKSAADVLMMVEILRAFREKQDGRVFKPHPSNASSSSVAQSSLPSVSDIATTAAGKRRRISPTPPSSPELIVIRSQPSDKTKTSASLASLFTKKPPNSSLSASGISAKAAGKRRRVSPSPPVSPVPVVIRPKSQSKIAPNVPLAPLFAKAPGPSQISTKAAGKRRQLSPVPPASPELIVIRPKSQKQPKPNATLASIFVKKPAPTSSLPSASGISSKAAGKRRRVSPSPPVSPGPIIIRPKPQSKITPNAPIAPLFAKKPAETSRPPVSQSSTKSAGRRRRISPTPPSSPEPVMIHPKP